MPLKILKITNTFSSQVQHLLENNPIGTPGVSMVYQHRNVLDKLRNISRPHYVNLERNERLIGTCCFCERIEKETINYYIRYFAFQKSNRVNRNTGSSKYGSGLIKRDVEEILKGTVFSNKGNKPSIFYAYLDPSNERSRVLCESFGFQKIRDFQSVLFSRFYPKNKLEVSLVKEHEKAEVISGLQEFYRDYNFFDLENIFFESNYYVYKIDGEIIAGIQAIKENWHIHELPGISGYLMLNVFSKIPVIKKLIKREFKFLALEGLFFKPGYEDKIESMIESVLCLTNQHIAMTVLDLESNLYQLCSSINKGFITKINKPKNNRIILKGNGSIDLNRYKKRPSYISTMDLS